MLKSYNYDLAVMEIRLKDLDGFEVIRVSRAARVPTPVLVLSEEREAATKVRAFSTGADDYVTRPYESMELTARMQAVIRRSKGYSEPTLRAGPLELCLDSRTVSVQGHCVHLTGKEYMILELLLLRKGMVLTKDAFLNHLYGGMDEPEMKIIDVFICKLRKKIAGCGRGAAHRHRVGAGLCAARRDTDPGPGTFWSSDASGNSGVIPMGLGGVQPEPARCR